MKFNTVRFGEIEVLDEQIFHFNKGIPGYEQLQLYTLITVDEHAPFAYLQSVEDGNLAFIVIDPFEFFSDYEFELPEAAKEELKLESPEHAAVRTIVAIKDKLEQATTNLVAPIVINRSNRRGKQVVLAKSSYTTRCRLFADDTVK
ncbi:flagellar assembly protein FliW [Cohnella pontilimi]|uniref:Flagellar assembly factor FliW n=1 Tax=Cohnella pontilimi TaxID=2564100 RepID=A0A4U0FB68_9BACL|nr:flagellar assembly protein FliW [Cohnella pontilimi]TJY41950.1 flagellar assembly protein FliW [Cohnella pontilimi]